MSKRALVIGDVMTDIVVVPEGDIMRGTDVRASIRQMPGGSGANQAVWLAALGVPVTFVGRVGAGDVDALGGYFSHRGVNSMLSADPVTPTGTLVCLIDKEGERSFLTDRGANTKLGTADLPMALLDGIDLLHVSGYSLFETGPRTAVLALIAGAHAAGAAVSIDPSSTGFLREVGPLNFLDWTSGADFIFPNAEEAELLSGAQTPEEQIDALKARYRTVVLKRGPEGAVMGGEGRVAIAMPARPVEVVDTTGAGDAFLAGFVAAFLAGLPDADCLLQGVVAGGEAVSTLGAQPE